MENKKIVITTYSVEKVTVNVQKVRSKGAVTGNTADVSKCAPPELPPSPTQNPAESEVERPGETDIEQGEQNEK